MKYLLTIALCGLSFVPICGQTSRALLVAVDDYPEGSGWNPIHARNDLQLVVSMLARNNFACSEIRSLPGAEAGTALAGFFDLLKARVARLCEGRKRQQTPDLQSTHEEKLFGIGR